ncbi:hypothetical protein [Streptomyces sp. NPDC086989]|uniref:hypothetical protein n=1 Tax=Streptomyces sp. NPDC086989 TaxID=3365764 RepID=UPI003805685C
MEGEVAAAEVHRRAAGAAGPAAMPSRPVRHDPLLPDDPRGVGRYRLTARLGEGGMGTVYLGLSPGERRVAVKVVRADLAADPGFRQRFARETDSVRRVGGFHTAQVVDASSDAAPDLSAVVTACLSADPAARPAPAQILEHLGRGQEEPAGDWLPPAVRTMVGLHNMPTVDAS